MMEKSLADRDLQHSLKEKNIVEKQESNCYGFVDGVKKESLVCN